MSSSQVGPLLRRWREHRRLSQLALSAAAGVSQRHLSFVETGRSRPSPEMIIHLAEVMDVPLRDRNGLLIAAGHAPAYAETPLDHPDMAGIRAALDLMLQSHRPFPAVLVDRHWDVVDANPPATTLIPLLVDPGSPALTEPLNVMRLTFHPRGLRTSIANWEEVGPALLARVRRDAEVHPEDRGLHALVEELAGYPGLDRHEAVAPWGNRSLLVTIHYRTPGLDLRLFSTIVSVGSPLDVTLQELSAELFFPADDESGRLLRRLDGHSGRPAPSSEADPSRVAFRRR